MFFLPIQAKDLAVDESSFTGEPMPKGKNINPLPEKEQRTGVSGMTCVAFMGTLVRCGRGKGIVIETGTNSQFGELFTMMQEEEVFLMAESKIRKYTLYIVYK